MIIGITGLIGSGKDTAADYLCTVHGFRRMSFAASLKDAVAIIFNWDRELLEGSTTASREWREQVDQWWAARLGIPNLTPRWVLQQWGTEVGRQAFHNDIWVASLESKLRNTTDDVVITDCRFSNEIQAIRNAGGVVMRTHRGEQPEWTLVAVSYNTTSDEKLREVYRDSLENKFGVHASEYSSVGIEYDYHLDNTKTIDYLHTQLLNIINQEKDHLGAKSPHFS